MPFSGFMQYAPDPTKAENLNDPPGQFKAQPGALQMFNGNVYQYVVHQKGTGSVATTNGHPAFVNDQLAYKTTGDKTSCQHGASNASGAMGVYLGVVTDLYGTWIQRTGYHANVKTNAAGAPGQCLTIPASDVDSFTVVVWTTVASQVCGVQLAAGADSTHVIADLKCYP